MNSYRPQTERVLAQRNHHDYRQDPYLSLCPPYEGLSGSVYDSIAYSFSSAQSAADIFEGSRPGFAYPRIACGTPPVDALRKALLDLELNDSFWKDEYDVLLTSSGMSALSLVSLALCHDDARTIFSSPYVYGGTYNLFDECLPRLSIKTFFVNNPRESSSWLSSFEHVLSAHRSFMFIEDRANPLLLTFDHQLLASIAHQHKIPYVVDMTIPTPIVSRPLTVRSRFHRPDVVIHSLSKNISGHSRCLGGAIIARKKFIGFLRSHWLPVIGCIMDAGVADKILHGMRDLEERMRRKIDSARTIVDFLKKRREIAHVHWSGVDLISFELEGTVDDARRVVEHFDLIVFAPHLGDIRTLAIHPASTTHCRVPRERREQMGLSDTLIRLSVGMEDPLDIIDDLSQSLGRMKEDT